MPPFKTHWDDGDPASGKAPKLTRTAAPRVVDERGDTHLDAR
jgi:hypothetical protein